jgi:hypothetical protein
MESEESKKVFDELQEALGEGYTLKGRTVQVIREIKISPRKSIAYARYTIDEKGKRFLTIESVQGDNEYISEISKEQRKRIEKLGFKFLEE